MDEQASEDRVLRMFDHRWVCGVVRSGYHNGAHCDESEPHDGWGCGWRWEASFTDETWDRLRAAVSDEATQPDTPAESALSVEALADQPVRPCGCGRPLWSESDEEEFDAAGAPHDPDRWCPHWCIEDVPHNAVKKGDWFAIQGDVPLEVSWHEAVEDADPVTGAFPHRSIYSSGIHPMHSTPFDPVQPCHVLRLGMVGRQTVMPIPAPADPLAALRAMPEVVALIEADKAATALTTPKIGGLGIIAPTTTSQINAARSVLIGAAHALARHLASPHPTQGTGDAG